MKSLRSRSFAAEGLVVSIAAILCGIIEAALIQAHRAAGVDPFHDGPPIRR